MTLVPVQTPYLRMTGLGTESAPADPADPHDLEGPGIHLRWAFPTREADGAPVELGWPQDGFALLRRPAWRPETFESLDLPGDAKAMGDDATLDVPGGAVLEFDPDVVAATRARVPNVQADLNRFLDAYRAYLTLRFDRPARMVALFVTDRPHGGADPRLAVVRAHDGDQAVHAASVVGDTAPDGRWLLVAADHITHLRIRLDGLRIVAILFYEAPTVAELDDWTRVAVLPPEPDWTLVRDRIPPAQQPAYEPGWADAAAELGRLFDPSDRRPRWLRAFRDAGVSADGASAHEAPTWAYLLQPQLLLFTVDPFLARLLGLLFVDTSPEVAGGGFFDYLVVGRFEVPEVVTPPPGGGPIGTPALTRERRPPPDGLVGWICHARSTLLRPPLPAPVLTAAELTPPRSFLPDPATGTLTEQARVGLSWTLRPAGAGGSLDRGPVRYDVEVRPEGETDWTLLTPEAKVLVSAAAADGPAFVDRRGAGTHEWRVRGIDVFGRRSAPSAPLAATIRDTVGPPPPVNLWARWLDPADPFLAVDERGLGEGLLVRFDLPRRPYEAGADARELTVHAVTGARDRALDWHDPAPWGPALATVPRTPKETGEVTAVAVLAGADPARRRARVTTTLTGGGAAVPRPGHLMVGEQEYEVEAVEGSAFVLGWPVVLGLPDPVPGPCVWYPGYQVFLAGYRPPLRGAASVSGAAAVGAVDANGNRGRISSAAAFQRVDRAPPGLPGALDVGVEELLAAPPDAYGRSRFVLEWAPAGGGALHHVLRALDSAVLARHGLTVADGRQMDAAALMALADDPVAEPAFAQLTSAPVAGTSFVDETLAAGANRHFYRLRTVSAAGVAGPLGSSTPPVAVPDVIPPRAPRIVRALGGPGEVTLTIAPNREHDLDHYVVYRAASAAEAADTRRMAPVGTVAPDPAAPALTFVDADAPPGVDHRYRVTALDRTGNESAASAVVVGRCFTP